MEWQNNVIEGLVKNKGDCLEFYKLALRASAPPLIPTGGKDTPLPVETGNTGQIMAGKSTSAHILFILLLSWLWFWLL